MKILISGGHLTPALAFIDHINQTSPETKITFVGRHYSQEKAKQVSHEAQEIEKRQLEFVNFRAPRLTSSSPFSLILALPPLGIATFRAIFLIKKLRPAVFLSFGGYLAVPIAIACWFNRVPIVTHEQTRASGLANQLIARLAKKVALSYETSQTYFAKSKSIITGNPLRPQIFEPQTKPAWIASLSAKPILYITGGNQGSEIINTVTQQALRPLLSQWFVIHQCGNPTARRNYKAELEQTQKRLPANLKNNYAIREWVTESELGWIYQHAALVVSRAGANTISELIASHVPALLIPLPFAHYGEQELNAVYMKELGGAEILAQKDLNAASLLKKVNWLKKHQPSMHHQLLAAPVHPDAAQKLLEVVLSVANQA